MPAKHKGDFGIDVVILGKGCTYQCYAADAYLPTNERYEKQRDKLNEDLAKLEKNDDVIAEIVGDHALGTYYFMVPLHESSQLVAYAAKRSAEYGAKGLRCLSPTFQIIITTDQDFPRQLAEIVSLGLQTLTLVEESVDILGTTSWGESHSDLVENLERKAQQLETLDTGEKLSEFRDLMLKRFLSAENILGLIEEKYVDTWAKFIRLKAESEARIELESLVGPGESSAKFFSETLVQFEDRLRSEIASLRPQSATLAAGTVADWLLRCPLDFDAHGTPNG
jgi:hypothetical protein